MMIISDPFYVEENEKVCCNCKYFRQHYVYDKHYKRFTTCNAGHCVKPRIKNREPEQKACGYFEWKNGGSNV